MLHVGTLNRWKLKANVGCFLRIKWTVGGSGKNMSFLRFPVIVNPWCACAARVTVLGSLRGPTLR